MLLLMLCLQEAGTCSDAPYLSVTAEFSRHCARPELTSSILLHSSGKELSASGHCSASWNTEDRLPAAPQVGVRLVYLCIHGAARYAALLRGSMQVPDLKLVCRACIAVARGLHARVATLVHKHVKRDRSRECLEDVYGMTL